MSAQLFVVSAFVRDRYATVQAVRRRMAQEPDKSGAERWRPAENEALKRMVDTSREVARIVFGEGGTQR